MIQDYHEGRPAGRPQGRGERVPRRHWPRWAARALLLAVLAGGLAWVGVRAARAMTPWAYFRVVEVVVEGNLHVGRAEILAALQLPPGASLLTLDLSALGGRLAASPWVKEATLERRLPDRLLVRLVERAPAAILRADAAYLVSGDGVILEEAGDGAGPALPVLRAPAGRRYAVGERVALQELNDALWAWRQVHLAPALGGRRPAEVALSPDGSYRVRMQPGPLAVRLRPEELEAQLQRLGAVLALRGGALEEVEEVDLRFPEKVILRQRGVGLRPATAPGMLRAAVRRGRAPADGPPRGADGAGSHPGGLDRPGKIDARPDLDRLEGR